VTGAWYSSSAGGLAPPENEELARRRFQWFYYLLRAPFFEAVFAGGALGGLLERFRTTPVLGVVGSIVDYVDTYRDYYFYLNA